MKRGWTYQAEIYRPTPRIALNGSFDEYLARIEKKQRHEIRRKMRRAAESELNVRFVIIDINADIETEINDFFHLMTQDPNKANFLTPLMREQMTVTIRVPRLNRAISGWLFWKLVASKSPRRSTSITKINYGATTQASAANTWNSPPAGFCSRIPFNGVAKTDATNSTSCVGMRNTSIALEG